MLLSNLAERRRKRSTESQLRYQAEHNTVKQTAWIKLGQDYNAQTKEMIKELMKNNISLPAIVRDTGVPLSFLRDYIKDSIKRPCIIFVVALHEYVKIALDYKNEE